MNTKDLENLKPTLIRMLFAIRSATCCTPVRITAEQIDANTKSSLNQNRPDRSPIRLRFSVFPREKSKCRFHTRVPFVFDLANRAESDAKRRSPTATSKCNFDCPRYRRGCSGGVVSSEWRQGRIAASKQPVLRSPCRPTDRQSSLRRDPPLSHSRR